MLHIHLLLLSLIATSHSNSRDNNSTVYLEVKDHAEASMASR